MNQPGLIKHDDEYYRSRRPKPNLGPYENIKKFVWDPDRRAFLDRNAREWRNFGLFYLCFFGGLFTISYVQLWLAIRYVESHDKPILQWEGYKADAGSLIRAALRVSSQDLNGPGIAMRPNIYSEDDSPVILLDETRENGKPSKYIEEITKTMFEYRNSSRSNFDVNCSDRVLREDNVEKACYFNVDTLGTCSQPPYGYALKKPQPCVYIKFNKRINWLPIFYSQASRLPEAMPKWLKKHIRDSDKFHVWLSCEGEAPQDRDSIGVVEYLPTPGFPVQFYPYSRQKYYHAPMVALHFKNVTANKRVNIVCKTWARNIEHNNGYNLEFGIYISKNNKSRIPE